MNGTVKVKYAKKLVEIVSKKKVFCTKKNCEVLREKNKATPLTEWIKNIKFIA